MGLWRVFFRIEEIGFVGGKLVNMYKSVTRFISISKFAFFFIFIKIKIVLWMNTVGPYSNRQETYAYFSLPFCRGPKHSISHYHETLGEALLGVELDYSGLDIKFKGYYMQLNRLVYSNLFNK